MYDHPTTVPHFRIRPDSGKGVWKRRLEPALRSQGSFLHVADGSNDKKAYMLAHNLVTQTADRYRQPGVWDIVTVEGKCQVYAKLVMRLPDAYSYRHHHFY